MALVVDPTCSRIFSRLLSDSMRAVVQRVSSASVTIAGIEAGAIGRGLLILLGIDRTDAAADGAWLARKLASARLFADEQGKLNRSLRDINGRVLVVSQFTLFGTLDKGTRPDFHRAAPPDQARALYETFLGQLEAELGERVERGEFGADMQVALVNDGPVTLLLDSPRPAAGRPAPAP
jgi:D-tyrosyl-tRNA(Tyr) deacylase